MAERRKRDRQATPEEAALFHTVLKDAAPLKGRRRPQPAPVGPPQGAVPPAAGKPGRPTAPARPKPTPLTPPAPELRHDAAPGVDRRTVERLRRGALPIEATLDLHGHTQAAARRALDGFIADSAEAGRRCVLVITGKGGHADPHGPEGGAFAAPSPGVLRSQVPRWLNLPPARPRILAFAQAQPRHGGAGALYVLLKRRRAG